MPSAMTLRHLKNIKKVSETGVQKIKKEMVQNKRGKQPRAQFTWVFLLMKRFKWIYLLAGGGIYFFERLLGCCLENGI